MAVRHAHSFLVHPGQGPEDGWAIRGAAIPLKGKLFELLSGVYQKSETECDIEISFNHADDGTQKNACRDALVNYVKAPSVARGRVIAERLGAVTTNRSGLGLLFLLAGREGKRLKLVVSRFPADTGVLAEEGETSLSVEFLERVFMKNAHAYKAAAYSDSSLSSGFWFGRAIDKQISSRPVRASNYWIRDFLESDFKTTPAAGTRRLAIAMRDAAKKAAGVEIKQEIASAATLASNLRSQSGSIRDLTRQMNLSDEARAAIHKEVRFPALLEEKFQFDLDEFVRHVAYRSIELDSGGVVMAEAGRFDEAFSQEFVDEADGIIRFSTEGKILNERIGRKR